MLQKLQNSEYFRVSYYEVRVILGVYSRVFTLQVVLWVRVSLGVFYPDEGAFLGSILVVLGVLRVF